MIFIILSFVVSSSTVSSSPSSFLISVDDVISGIPKTLTKVSIIIFGNPECVHLTSGSFPTVAQK